MVTDNPFVCDCGIAWFRDWVTKGKGANAVNLPKETKCNSPELLRRMPISEIPYEYLSCTNSTPLIQIHSLPFSLLSCFIYFMYSYNTR